MAHWRRPDVVNFWFLVMNKKQNRGTSKKNLEARIFHHIENGVRPSELSKALQNDPALQSGDYPTSREQISRLVWDAIEDKRLKFVPEAEEKLAAGLKATFVKKWKADYENCVFDVVPSTSAAQMAVVGAQMLLKLIQTCWEEKKKKQDSEPLRIGFAGGITSALILSELPKWMLRNWDPSQAPSDSLPRKLVFHAVNAILASGNPDFNPSAYFHSFYRDQNVPIDTEFVAFPAPGIVLKSEWAKIEKLRTVEEAVKYADKLDIVLGSGGHWGGGHRTLCDYITESCIKDDRLPDQCLYSQWEKEAAELKHAGCVGDLFWQPVFRNPGKASVKQEIGVASLFKLDQLSGLIKNGTRVMIILAPCSGCMRPKDELLEAILNFQTQPLVTHLVVNTHTAASFLQSHGEA
jgi:hypothetical protein